MTAMTAAHVVPCQELHTCDHRSTKANGKHTAEIMPVVHRMLLSCMISVAAQSPNQGRGTNPTPAQARGTGSHQIGRILVCSGTPIPCRHLCGHLLALCMQGPLRHMLHPAASAFLPRSSMHALRYAQLDPHAADVPLTPAHRTPAQHAAQTAGCLCGAQNHACYRPLVCTAVQLADQERMAVWSGCVSGCAAGAAACSCCARGRI